MKSPHRISTIIFLQLSLLYSLTTGCATTAQRVVTPLREVRNYDSTYDQVWNAAIKGLLASDQKIILSEKDSGVIKVDRKLSQEEIWNYANLDGWNKFWNTWKSFYAETNLVIQPISSHSSGVRINSQITGIYEKLEANWRFDTEYRLISSGKMENEYFDLLEKELR